MTTSKIRIRELNNIINRFPKEFYKIYSNNDIFKNNKIYKIYVKDYNQENIIITENIDVFYKMNGENDDMIDILEKYDNRDVIYIDKYGLQHINFFDILVGLDNLEFNWSKNKFYYKYKHKKINHLKTNEKNNLIKYLKNKKDTFEHNISD